MPLPLASYDDDVDEEEDVELCSSCRNSFRMSSVEESLLDESLVLDVDDAPSGGGGPPGPPGPPAQNWFFAS